MTSLTPITRVSTEPHHWGSQEIAQHIRTPEAHVMHDDEPDTFESRVKNAHVRPMGQEDTTPQSGGALIFIIIGILIVIFVGLAVAFSRNFGSP